MQIVYSLVNRLLSFLPIQKSKFLLFLVCNILIVQLYAISITAPRDTTIIVPNGSCTRSFVLTRAPVQDTCTAGLNIYQTIAPFSTLNTNGGTLTFPKGLFNIIYKVTDACGAMALDTMILRVVDTTPAQVVCSVPKQISLTNNGFAVASAITFNGTSMDDCGMLFYKVRRMNTAPMCPTPDNPLNRFYDNVRFCCSDIGNNQLRVILRIYDEFVPSGVVSDTLLRGHFVDCMLLVEIQDKLEPEVACPLSTIAECSEQFEDLSRFGYPIITDNCGISRIDSSVFYNFTPCGTGTITRNYTVYDRSDNSTECVQDITVENSTPFNGLDPNQLLWPNDFTITSCMSNADTSITGQPIINESRCDLVLTNFKDDKYYIGKNSVCYKILRYWHVVDWCQYQKGEAKIPANGYYTHIQEIKLMDTSKPIIAGIRDTAIVTYSGACFGSTIQLNTFTASDCNQTKGFRYYTEIDFECNGTIDQIIPSNQVSTYFPNGISCVFAYAVDSCGTTGVKEIQVNLSDAKGPNVVIINGLSVNVSDMGTMGIMIPVPAKLYDKSSTDNCGGPLRFSYSEDVNDTIRVYDCDSIGNKTTCIYVWDKDDNYTKVCTYLIITDSDSICPKTIKPTYSVSGLIKHNNGNMMQSISCNLLTPTENMNKQTNDAGIFMFDNLDIGTEGKLYSSYQDEPTAEITTADILRIQKHILGIEPFTDPKAYLSADVDENKSVSAKDISLLRKLILGVIPKLPGALQWKFVPEAMQFNSFEDIYQLPGDMIFEYSALKTDYHTNAIALKVGDVNFSSGKLKSSDNRSKAKLHYEIQSSNNGAHELVFKVDQSMSVEGLQMELAVQGMIPNIQGLSQFNIISNRNGRYIIRVSIVFDQLKKLLKDDVIFSMPIVLDNTTGINVVTSKGLSATLYESNEERDIYIHSNSNAQLAAPIQIEVLPNPCADLCQFQLRVDAQSDLTMTIYNLLGKAVWRTANVYQQGEYYIPFSAKEYLGSGSYILQVESTQFKTQLQFIVK